MLAPSYALLGEVDSGPFVVEYNAYGETYKCSARSAEEACAIVEMLNKAGSGSNNSINLTINKVTLDGTEIDIANYSQEPSATQANQESASAAAAEDQTPVVLVEPAVTFDSTDIN